MILKFPLFDIKDATAFHELAKHNANEAFLVEVEKARKAFKDTYKQSAKDSSPL